MIRGGLFTGDFLSQGIRETEAWGAVDPARIAAIRVSLIGLFTSFQALKRPTEADTEQRLIWPVIEALGWKDLYLTQQKLAAKGRDDVPDGLLFPDATALAVAEPLDAWQRFRHGACVVESKRWLRLLDREDQRGDVGVPSTQMLRYLRRAEDLTQGKLRWGLLTNGRFWRLYWQGALSVAEDFFEIDLPKALGLPGFDLDLLDHEAVGSKDTAAFPNAAALQDHVLRLFVLLFERSAFLPNSAGQTFHDLAIQEGKFWEQRVAQNLSVAVFDGVFPLLASAIVAADRTPVVGDAAYLAEVRENALILLYRLLFVLYAEDRNLLPEETGPYADYALTRMRLEIAERKESGRSFSGGICAYWERLFGIFRAIEVGDDSLGIPPYNGGLFEPSAAPLLGRVRLPDAVMAEVLFALSHQSAAPGRRAKYINYRDLSVQQLGSVYERILEHGLIRTPDGTIAVATDAKARRSSGSYYTPEDLVTLIIERAVGPLVKERLDRFRDEAARIQTGGAGRRPEPNGLAAFDPAEAMLTLKICDPAMGSGHFLVSLVDWLSDQVLAAMPEAAAAVTFATYESPLAARIVEIRRRIREAATRHGWIVSDDQLDDRHIVRRMILKRVVYGVDKNPMAVELAKVALWLHSFTVGAPLSFLDHHLRCGDSIIGARVRPTLDELRKRGALFNIGLLSRVEAVAGLMAEIEATTDNDIAEVQASKQKFGVVEESTEPLAALFSLITAEHVMGVFDAAPQKAPNLDKLAGAGKSPRELERAREGLRAFERAAAFRLVIEGAFGDPLDLATGNARVASTELAAQASLLEDRPDAQSSLFDAISMNDRRRLLADGLVS